MFSSVYRLIFSSFLMHPIGNTLRSEKDSEELSYDANVFSIFLSLEKIYA